MNTDIIKLDVRPGILANIKLNNPDWIRGKLDRILTMHGTQIERDYLVQLLVQGDFIEFGNRVMEQLREAALSDAKDDISDFEFDPHYVEVKVA